MRNLSRKEGLLIISAVLLFWTVAATATSYTRPYGSSDYAGGQKAVGPKVNSEFDGLANFLNGQNLDSTNFVPLGITSASLGAGSVTPSKLSTANLLVTSSSSLYSITSTVTPVTVTNLSTTFTSNGRPAIVRLEPNPGTYLLSNVATLGAFVDQFTGDARSDALFFVRDSATTAYFYLSTLQNSGTVKDARWQCPAFSYTETSLVANTSYVFAVKVGLANTGDTVNVVNCRLVVEEY